MLRCSESDRDRLIVLEEDEDRVEHMELLCGVPLFGEGGLDRSFRGTDCSGISER